MELSGGSRGGARPLILGIKEEMTEGKKASSTVGHVNRDQMMIKSFTFKNEFD